MILAGLAAGIVFALPGGEAAVGFAVFTYLGLRAHRHGSTNVATPAPVDG